MQIWSNQEIIYSYKTAKDQAAQIDILSDLTLKSPAEIESILRAAGLPVKARHKKSEAQAIPPGVPGRPPVVWTEDEEKRLARLLNARTPGAEVVELMGRTRHALEIQVHKMRARGMEVNIHFNEKTHAWTTEELKKIEGLLSEGAKPAEICTHFPGRTYSSVKKAIYRIRHKGA